MTIFRRGFAGATLGLAAALVPTLAQAGGGYFLLGYGPLAGQSGGTSTAIGFDGMSGSNNPAKLSFVDNRLDADILFFLPHREVQRSGAANPAYDFSSTSANRIFPLPEFGYAHRINRALSWGLTVYGNGGLNTSYHDDNGVPGSNANPQACGNRPANFLLGCGRVGFDLGQIIVAPHLAWRWQDRYSVGIAPLLGFQRFNAYGLQAFETVSAHPNAVSNVGYDTAFGVGVRVGVFVRATPWLDVGAAYSSPVFMQRFDKYRGLIAGRGSFDIPQNFSVGIGLKPFKHWVFGFDVQQIQFHDIPALGNGVLNSLADPVDHPLGSRTGSGFNWRNATQYRGAVAYEVTRRLTIRAGADYSRRPPQDSGIDSVSFNMLAPNPIWRLTAGFTFKLDALNDLQFAYGNYVHGKYSGPSATAGLGVGGTETGTPHVNTVVLGWSHHFR